MLSSNHSPQKILGSLFSALLFLAISCVPTSAEVLYTNGAPDLTNTGETFNADNNLIVRDMVGDVFTPTASGTANTVNFAGLYFSSNTVPTSDTFTITLYSVSAGAPNTLLDTSTLSGETRTPVGAGGLDGDYTVYDFSGTLNTTFSLSTGTSYYLGIADATSPYEGFNVAYSDGSATSLYQGVVGVGNFESDPGHALSFSLNAVPEPTTAPLLLGGLGLLAFWHRRTRRSTFPV